MVQLGAFLLEYFPTSQIPHSVIIAVGMDGSENLPASHSRHSFFMSVVPSNMPPDIANLPASHSKQSEAPSLEYFPNSQILHESEARCELFPAGQISHCLSFLAFVLKPASHLQYASFSA